MRTRRESQPLPGRRTYAALFCVIITLPLSAFGDDKPSGTGADHDLVPLEVGNQWIFRVTRFTVSPMDDGTSFDTVVNSITYDTVLLVRDTVLNGDRWYLIGHPIPGMDPAWMAYRDDGIWISVGLGDDALFRELNAKWPAAVGDTFYVGLPPTVCEVEGTAVDVQVPAGTFRTICYRTDSSVGDGVVGRSYYAVGIGRVRNELCLSKKPSYTLWEIRELESMNLR